MNQDKNQDQAEKKRVEDVTRRINFIFDGFIIGIIIGALYLIFKVMAY